MLAALGIGSIALSLRRSVHRHARVMCVVALHVGLLVFLGLSSVGLGVGLVTWRNLQSNNKCEY